MPVDPTSENKAQCICPECPTYDECMTMEEEVLYCGTSVTMCEDTQRNGCNCGACDVRAAYELAGTYYCVSGPAE